MTRNGKSSVSVVLIGCGAWGKNWARVLSKRGELAAIVESDVQRHAELGRQYPDVHIYSNLEAALSRGSFAAAVIAAPVAQHADLARALLLADRDVLVEKPLALSVAEGTELVRTAADRKRILMVGHVLEYHPAVQALKRLIDSGELGRVQYIYSNRLNIGRIRIEENAWWSFAPHDVAVILRFLGRAPEEIVSFGGAHLNPMINDFTVTHLKFSENVQAHIFVSWLHPFKEQRLIVVGDRQMAVFDDTQDWPSKLILYSHRIARDGKVPVAHQVEGVRVSLEPAEPLAVEAEAFAEAVRSRRQPLADGVSGLRVLEVLEAAEASLNRSQPGIFFDEKEKVSG